MTILVRALSLSLLFLVVPGTAQAAPAVKPFEPTAGDDPALVAAWEKWEAKGIDDYTTAVQLSCFCLESPVVRTVVKNDRIRAVYEARDRSASKGYSMDQLFHLLRDAYASADSVTVKYTPRGIPKKIAIDPEKMAADEETYYTVSLWRS